MVCGVYPFTVQMERRNILRGSDIRAAWDEKEGTVKAEKGVASFGISYSPIPLLNPRAFAHSFPSVGKATPILVQSFRDPRSHINPSG